MNLSKMSKKETPEEVQRLLKILHDHFDKEDQAVRERQIRQWKKLKYYWNGFRQLWWDETAHDWRTYSNDVATGDGTLNDDTGYFDKSINVFRAYLESIIAALSVTVPSIKCFPDDADNPLDMATAKSGDKIAELVGKHNDQDLLWLHALYILCTEGLVAAYSYSKEDEAYGTYQSPNYEDVDENQEMMQCPACQGQIPDETETIDNRYRDEFAPDSSDAGVQDLLSDYSVVCPACFAQVKPNIVNEKIVVTKLTGMTTKPKARQCIEVHGGLFVKVANYAQCQKDTPYLRYSYETHYTKMIDRYPDLRDKILGISKVQPGGYTSYEQWGRLSTQYRGEYPLNNVTVNNEWYRPSSFNILPDEEDVKTLKKLYPSGARVVFINEVFAEAENECLDDCWTLTHNPLDDYVHHDPLGNLLTAVQEITTDMLALIIQTIEHGIPQTFVTPDVMNTEAYKKLEASPGAIIVTKPLGGKSLPECFHEVSTAQLGSEVQPFLQKTQELGQLVSGALPSLFGGAAPNSSKTAAQYSMSRQQSLQRLQTSWKMLSIWWKTIYGKVIPAYIKTVVEDEKLVEKDESGNFINVFIRKAELQGKIGQVELESSDQLPMSWSQQKDAMMTILQQANPEILDKIGALTPENIPSLAEVVGMNNFVTPGDDDRSKQYEEIRALTQSVPFPDPESHQDGEAPSVDIEPIIDDHPVHIYVCRAWAVSDAGRLTKIENPDGYKNVILHLQRHLNYVQQVTQQAQLQQQAMAAPVNKPQQPMEQQ